MKDYITIDEWNIIEEGFTPENNRVSESIFSIGNGKMGQRANFEETYTGDRLQGSYVAGVYYPDKTRVGWWKIGYPEYFAKVLNAPNWIGLEISISDQILDLATCKILDFKRILNMKEGYLERIFRVRLQNGYELQVVSQRFCSIYHPENGLIRYQITSLNFDDTISVLSYLDADVINEDANYNEKFWEEVGNKINKTEIVINVETRKNNFQVCTGIRNKFFVQDTEIKPEINVVEKEKFGGHEVKVEVLKGQTFTIEKYASVVSSLDYNKKEIVSACCVELENAFQIGFEKLKQLQAEAWLAKWHESDIQINGDIKAQQGIRFNIFQLYQTYTGKDERLNIGPKGFTGEKYGGSTYWDTEAYCLPFYMSTANEDVARHLLLYRYKHLPKAIENAKKLGFNDGAALYPMVTMNGEECHNEWEITFEEIHRNGAIAYAIFDFVRYTGDYQYLIDYGLEVLIAIARFWAQRVNWSELKQQYVILGVTGPNEYENNVSNNWYTNKIATWCLSYAMEVIAYVKTHAPGSYQNVRERICFDENKETVLWERIIDKMYLPYDPERGIYLQQEGFLDKELIPASELNPNETPLNQNWSWDRILRSCYIKQADVLQGMYWFEEEFDEETIRRNFDFYEPLTIHESSLSPCVHAILAARLGYKELAYKMYLRTSRLDLDDYNNDTDDGCHITSMGGTWMSIVKGFGGLRVKDGSLNLNPIIPDNWKSYSFRIRFRGSNLNIEVTKEAVTVSNDSKVPVSVFVRGQLYDLDSSKAVIS